jgi:type VI secretion system protein ImpC
VEGGVEMWELPFVVGVLGDFGGYANRVPLGEREFVPIDRDNFIEVMKRCDVRLRLPAPIDKSVRDLIDFGPYHPFIELRFESLEDFEPSRVTRQIAFLGIGASSLDSVLAPRNPDELSLDFPRLEGAWRGLHYLVTRSETSRQIQIKFLDLGKDELRYEQGNVALTQSEVYRKIAVEPYRHGVPEPFGVLIGDHEFDDNPDDVWLLTRIAALGSAACCPFVAAASPWLLGLRSWRELNEPRELTERPESPARAAWTWNRFRDSDESRYVVLTAPRTLARLPYGADTPIGGGLAFDGSPADANTSPPPDPHARLCWMNTAYVLGAHLAGAFARRGLCLGLRANVDAEVWDFQPWAGEGRIDGLPRFVAPTLAADPQSIGPTEIAVTSRRERELSRCGVLALCHNGQTAAFLSTPSCQRPKRYGNPEATANAFLAADLSCTLVMSRFAHYVKAIYETESKTRDQDEMQRYLDRWICNYVSACGPPSGAAAGRFPLADAKIELCDDPSRPEGKLAVIWLRPWLDHGGLTSSPQTVIRLN